jgi:hypothetical protein
VSIRDHAAAIKARLEQDTVLASCTFEGVVTDRPQRYCAFFINSGYREQYRQTGPDARADFNVTVHSVGVDPAQAQAVAERVYAQLLGFIPAVTGRRCARLRSVSAQPTQIDDTVQPPVFYSVDEFTFISDPA